MKEQPYFSIVIPVYNVEKYIKNCINTILMQTFADYEILLVDDGSTDQSGKICDYCSAKTDRIKVIHQKNCGLPSARNAGLKCAMGAWVIFIDSDDRIDSADFLKEIYQITKNGNMDIVTYGLKQVRESDGKIIRTMYENMVGLNHFLTEAEKLHWCIRSGRLSISACLHACSKQFLIDNNLYFDESLRTAEDIEWYFRVLSNKPNIYGMSGTPYLYLVRENSICTSVKKSGFWRYREKAIKSVLEMLKNSDLGEDYKEEMYSALAYHYYIHIAELELEPDRIVKKEAFQNARDLNCLQNYKGDKKTNFSRIIVKVFGVNLGAKIMNGYIKINAFRKGISVRKENK